MYEMNELVEFYYLNGNKLEPIFNGNKICGKEIELSNSYQQVKNCKKFMLLVNQKISKQNLSFCKGFNIVNVRIYCMEGLIYYY